MHDNSNIYNIYIQYIYTIYTIILFIKHIHLNLDKILLSIDCLRYRIFTRLSLGYPF